MGYYVISNLIKERINMTKEKMKQTIDTIKHLAPDFFSFNKAEDILSLGFT